MAQGSRAGTHQRTQFPNLTVQFILSLSNFPSEVENFSFPNFLKTYSSDDISKVEVMALLQQHFPALLAESLIFLAANLFFKWQRAKEER